MTAEPNKSNPSVKDAMIYQQSIFIHFDQCDPAGIVFFGNYPSLAHRVLEALLPAIGIPWREWFANPDFGVPLRHLDVHYLGSLRVGQTYQLRAQVLRVGRTSVDFLVGFWSENNKVCAFVHTTHVFVTMEPLAKTAIPSGLADKLRAAVRPPPPEFPSAPPV
jgi:acyl-CoA thioesterase FadM